MSAGNGGLALWNFEQGHQVEGMYPFICALQKSCVADVLKVCYYSFFTESKKQER
jgi:hypothetical protein